MMNWVNRTYLGAKIKCSCLINEMREEEAGVSSIVATVLLILIVVLLATVFWDAIIDWFGKMWDIIDGEGNGIPTTAPIGE